MENYIYDNNEVSVSAIEEPVEEVSVDHYADVNDEDYTKAEEPDFGEDL